MPEQTFYAGLGSPFIELLSVDSTNNYAFKQLHAGLAQHGTAYFAREQVAGKGQRGKTWTAPLDSSLILSIIVNPVPLSINQQFQWSVCVAVAVCEFFSRYAGSATRIKWPNDLYWQDRKAGGILIENIIGGQRTQPGSSVSPEHSTNQGRGDEGSNAQWLWSVAGIGININQESFPGSLKNPVSLKQIIGYDLDPAQLARELCSMLDDNLNTLKNGGFELIYSTYETLLYKRGETIRLKKENRAFEARLITVSRQGKLVVQHGVEEQFDFGSVEWVIPPVAGEN